MHDPTFHERTIAAHIHAADIGTHLSLAMPGGKQAAIQGAVAIGRDGFRSVAVAEAKIRGKSTYQVTDFAQILALRHINDNLRRITSAKQDHREFIVRCLIQILSEGIEFHVFKFDIKSFYESVDARQLVRRLQTDINCSGQSVRALASFLDCLRNIGVSGLPRGMAISATLSEYLLQEFDIRIREESDVRFYARFVDDVLVVCGAGADPLTFKARAKEALPAGLQFNHKSRDVHFGKFDKRLASADVEHSISYLGYELSISRVYRDRDSQRFLRDVRVDIADSKVKKLKSRIALSLYQFSRDHSYEDLRDRLRLMTSNFKFRDKHTRRTRVSGIHFSYPLVDADRSVALPALDKFLRNMIWSQAPRNRLRPQITDQERQELSRTTFTSGFKTKRFYAFTEARLSHLIGVWAYA